MHFKKIMLLSLGFFLYSSLLPAQEIIEIKGKKALLFEDGSWKYVDDLKNNPKYQKDNPEDLENNSKSIDRRENQEKNYTREDKDNSNNSQIGTNVYLKDDNSSQTDSRYEKTDRPDSEACRRMITSKLDLANKGLKFETEPITVDELSINWIFSKIYGLNVQILFPENQCVRKGDFINFNIGDRNQAIRFKIASESNCQGFIVLQPSAKDLERLLAESLNSIVFNTSRGQSLSKFSQNLTQEFIAGGYCMKELSGSYSK